MKTLTAGTVLKPYQTGVPLDLTVGKADRLSYAVEQMLSHNRTRLAVMEAGAPVGMIDLEEALLKLGIRVPASG